MAYQPTVASQPPIVACQKIVAYQPPKIVAYQPPKIVASQPSQLPIVAFRPSMALQPIMTFQPPVALQHPTVDFKHPIVDFKHPIVAFQPTVACQPPIVALQPPIVAFKTFMAPAYAGAPLKMPKTLGAPNVGARFKQQTVNTIAQMTCMPAGIG